MKTLCKYFLCHVENLFPLLAFCCGVFSLFRHGLYYYTVLPAMLQVLYFLCPALCYMYYYVAKTNVFGIQDKGQFLTVMFICFFGGVFSFLFCFGFFLSFYLAGHIWVAEFDIGVQLMFVFFVIMSAEISRSFYREFHGLK